MKADARKNNGGARAGAGRKPNTAPTKKGEVRLTAAQWAEFRALDGSPWLQGQLNLKIKARLAAAEKSEAEND